MKDREQIMEDYWETVTDEQLIQDIKDAGFTLKEVNQMDEEMIEISVEEMAEFASEYAAQEGVTLSKEDALLAYRAEEAYLRRKGLIADEE